MSAGPARRDPLLAVVRAILGIAMMLSVTGAAAFALAVPIIIAWRENVVTRLVGQGAPPETIWAIVAIVVMSVVLALLAFSFARHLYRIVGSVGEGDAFAPANAEHLRAMAWISVAVHVVDIPITILSRWVEDATGHIRYSVDFPLAGLFLALVLFILARVFREGTRMREDLEGTV